MCRHSTDANKRFFRYDETGSTRLFSMMGEVGYCGHEAYEGWDTGQTWNGWAMPVVNLVTFIRILRCLETDDHPEIQDIVADMRREYTKNDDQVFFQVGHGLCWDWVEK